MAIDSEEKRWSMLRVSTPGIVINPNGSNLDSVVERLSLLRIYGGLTASDTTPPVLSLPTGVATGDTTATGAVSTDEGNGTLYYWFTENASETASAIVASGASQAVSGTGVQNVSVTGLTALTTYYAHYVHDDAALNRSNVVSSVGFDTDTAAVVGDNFSGGWPSPKKKPKKLADIGVLPPKEEDRAEKALIRVSRANEVIRRSKPKTVTAQKAVIVRDNAEQLYVKIYQSVYPKLAEARIKQSLRVRAFEIETSSEEEDAMVLMLLH